VAPALGDGGGVSVGEGARVGVLLGAGFGEGVGDGAGVSGNTALVGEGAEVGGRRVPVLVGSIATVATGVGVGGGGGGCVFRRGSIAPTLSISRVHTDKASKMAPR